MSHCSGSATGRRLVSHHARYSASRPGETLYQGLSYFLTGCTDMLRLICSFAIVVAGIAFSGDVLAQSCPGKLIAVKPIRDSAGKKLAELQLYYSAATGKNCARTMHSSATWGKPLHTEVFLQTCKRKHFSSRKGCNASKPHRADNDWGTFRYQAGPVSVYGRNRCVAAQGSIVTEPGGRPTAFRVNIRGHCG